MAEELRPRQPRDLPRGAEYARQRGIIIADTKFEFGQADGETAADRRGADARQLALLAGRPVAPGDSQPSFDKQFVRDWLSATTWDKNSPPRGLPDDVVAKTRQRYR